MQKRILITGATGNVGREVIGYLKDAGRPVKAAVSNTEDAKNRLADVPLVRFDFKDLSTFKEALGDVDGLFLLRPPQMTDPAEFYPIIDYAKEAGVERIVFLSLMGIEKNPVVPHHNIEKYILKSGISYTFLRPSFYMQNLSTIHAGDIRDRDEICVPAGKGKTSFIDVRDIGAVAAKVLSEDGHGNKAYTLTGSLALDYYQVAGILSEALKRKIIYTNPSSREFAKRMIAAGQPKEFVTVMRGIYLVCKLRMAAGVTGDVEKLLGRKPIPFEQFANDYAPFFK